MARNNLAGKFLFGMFRSSLGFLATGGIMYDLYGNDSFYIGGYYPFTCRNFIFILFYFILFFYGCVYVNRLENLKKSAWKSGNLIWKSEKPVEICKSRSPDGRVGLAKQSTDMLFFCSLRNISQVKEQIKGN